MKLKMFIFVKNYEMSAFTNSIFAKTADVF